MARAKFRKPVIIAFCTATALFTMSTPTVAQSDAPATPAEITAVEEAIGRIGCRVGPSPVEREDPNRFEVDDAQCDIGQYDIKLDGRFVIVAITYDGPADDFAFAEAANAEETARVDEALDAVNCDLADRVVEREAEGLFEVDDVQCDAGNFDVKVDGDFNIVAMIRNGPFGAAVGQVPAPPPQQPAPQPPPPAPPPAGGVEAIVAVDLNLRLGPSTDYAQIVVIPQGAVVIVHRCTLDYEWCEVTYNATTGWVAAIYLRSVTLQQPIADVGARLGLILIEFIRDQFPRQPRANEVCFYADYDFQGDAFCTATGSSNTALSADWNDRISSIRVGANAMVEVCENIQYQGWCEIFDADVARLSGDRNDAISSYRSPAGHAGPPQPGAGEACFYADFNFQGDAFCIAMGESSPALGAEWNDRISSIRLGSGASVEVCLDNQFGGGCATYINDVAQLPADQNDAISSYRAPPAVGDGRPAAEEAAPAAPPPESAAEPPPPPAEAPPPAEEEAPAEEPPPPPAEAGPAAPAEELPPPPAEEPPLPLADGGPEAPPPAEEGPPPAAGPPAEADGQQPPANQLCFFEDFNFQGASFCVGMGQSNPALGADWNDRISSIRVGEGAAIEVCLDNNFGGECTTYGQNVPRLPGNQNDAISSFRAPG